ncbi:MAG TPA: glycosyltransferase family 4 protein [Candidatus Blautia intestinavium]|nr:glycosyltransferase family 4 protein [Candidatus Blautia intestinavium]
MNLLLYSAYYEPEVAASLYLSTNLYEDFAASGMNVRLYTPLPTRGVTDEVRNSYRGRIEKKIDNRLEIIRLNIPKESKSTMKRALRYLWMNFVFICNASKFDADAIFVQSTPPTQGAMAAIIKKKKKIPFIYNLQDVFPDSLVGAGMTKENSFIYRIGRRIEDYTYRNADRIIVISNDIKQNIINKGVPEEKIVVVPNWIDAEKIHPIAKEDNYLFDKYYIPKDKFTVVYAGNLGYAQNIEVIIKSAELLKEHKSIQFVVFGKGAQEDEYKEMAAGLDNVHFFPIQPYSEVSYVYSIGDVSVVPCKKGFGGSAMPSKTWSIMATGTPVLASFDPGTEMESIIKTEEVGLFNIADDFEGLTDNILKLYTDEGFKERLGMNARTYVENNLNRRVCTQKYIDTIMEIV